MICKICINYNTAERDFQHKNQIKKETQKFIVTDHTQPSGKGLISVP